MVKDPGCPSPGTAQNADIPTMLPQIHFFIVWVMSPMRNHSIKNAQNAHLA
jgi:hypothetical protein